MFSVAKGPKATMPTNAIEDRLLICTDTGEMFYDYATANIAVLGTNRVQISGGSTSGDSSGAVSTDWETRLTTLESTVEALPTVYSGTVVPSDSEGEDGDIYIQHV